MVLANHAWLPRIRNLVWQPWAAALLEPTAETSANVNMGDLDGDGKLARSAPARNP